MISCKNVCWALCVAWSIISMFTGGSWEVWLAASLVILAMEND